MRRTLLAFLLSIAAAGCGEPSGSPDAAVARLDAPSLDAAAPRDAFERPDSGRADIGLGPDASMRRDGGADAPSIDARALPDAFAPDAAARDAFSPDASADGGASRIVQCVPVVPSGAMSGVVFSRMFFPGFRFEVTSATRATRVGLQLTPDGTGTFTGTIVRLSGPGDAPDVADLSGADVIARTDVAVTASGAPIVASGAVDVALSPGWYALAFGTTGVGGTLPSGGTGGCRSSPGSSFPFTIRQSDGMFILQAAEPHLFVELTP